MTEKIYLKSHKDLVTEDILATYRPPCVGIVGYSTEDYELTFYFDSFLSAHYFAKSLTGKEDVLVIETDDVGDAFDVRVGTIDISKNYKAVTLQKDYKVTVPLVVIDDEIEVSEPKLLQENSSVVE